MYRCSEVVRLISSDEYLTAGILKKLGIRLHLSMCKYCSRYERQLRALAAALRRIDDSVTPADLERAKTHTLQQLLPK